MHRFHADTIACIRFVSMLDTLTAEPSRTHLPVVLNGCGRVLDNPNASSNAITCPNVIARRDTPRTFVVNIGWFAPHVVDRMIVNHHICTGARRRRELHLKYPYVYTPLVMNRSRSRSRSSYGSRSRDSYGSHMRSSYDRSMARTAPLVRTGGAEQQQPPAERASKMCMES